MKRIYLLLLTMLCLIFMFSCGNAKLVELKTTVKDVATKLENDLVKIRVACQDVDKALEDLYANTDMNTVDIKDMDESNGGRFYMFKNQFFVRRYDSKADETLLGATGAKPVTDTNKKIVKMLMTLEPLVMKTVKENPAIGRITYGSVENEFIGYPNGDIVSVVPAGFDYNSLGYFKATLGTDGGWFPPSISRGNVGVAMGRSEVPNVNGKKMGAMFAEVTVLPTMAAAIKGITSMVFIAYSDTSVYAATDTVKKAINLKVTEQIDYTEQISTIPSLSDEFKLSYEKNNNDIKALGALIKKENVGKDNTITINKKKFTIIMEAINERDFFIVGLI